MKGKKEMYKKNDIVLVYSLQSFFAGGFLNGEPAIVRQNQTGKSVIVMVVRNFNTQFLLDTSYEIYEKQLEPFYSAEDMNKKELKEIGKLFDCIEKDIESGKTHGNSRTCTKKTTQIFADIMARHELKPKGFILIDP